MVAFPQVAQSQLQARYHLCPRCGTRLVRDDSTAVPIRLARLVFLRGLRCNTKCGWRGFRFSRSLLRRRKRRLRATMLVMLFILATAMTVRYVLSRASSGQAAAHEGGVQEVE